MGKKIHMILGSLLWVYVGLVLWLVIGICTISAGLENGPLDVPEPVDIMAIRDIGGDVPASGYASLAAMSADGVVYTSDIYRSDVDLDCETQELLWMACDSAGVPYTLMLALVWRETGYRNVVGDNGASEGYCQVQRRWHGARMERLGVTDLMDPSGNFQVACDYMADLLALYSTEDALTVYNSGSPGKSAYSAAVLDKMAELERG